MHCSPSSSAVHGIFQAIILQWVAISFSRGSSWLRDWTHVSCLAGGFFSTEPPGKSFHLAIRGMQIKTIMKYHFTPTRMAIIKQTDNNKCREKLLTNHTQNYGFFRSHVQMWELNHKEGWAAKNWCFQIAVLEKILESPLDRKEIKPVNPKGNQPWTFIAKTVAETEAPILQPPDLKSQFTGKDLDAGERWKAKGEGGGRG